jgi:hypothetical protein
MITRMHVPADTRTLDEINIDDLRKELASLEAAESKISAERRQLHNQIDYGYASDATRAREREISDERRRLHQRIDSVRELLRECDPSAESEPTSLEPSVSLLSQWSGISPEVAAAESASADELEL